MRPHAVRLRARPRLRSLPLAAAVAALAMTIGGCAYKPNVIPPSQGHISQERAIPKAGPEDAPPPVTSTAFAVPRPRPVVKPPTYSVVVNDVPVKDLLFALARDTKQNIDIHPALSGVVSINAINETLPAILDRIAKQVNLRYRQEGGTLVITPDTPYLKTYRISYVNMTRDTESRIGVSGQITTPGGTGQTATGGAGGGSTAGPAGQNASQTSVITRSSNDFWRVLAENIRSILQSTRNQTLTAEDRATRAESARQAREDRIAQAEAVARAGAGAVNLFKEAFAAAPVQAQPGDLRDDIVVNAAAGTISVTGTDRQHALIQQHIDSVTSAVQRQVMIEATIAEVRLSDRYRAGVDWSRLSVSGGITFQQQLLQGNLTNPNPNFAIGYVNPASAIGNIAASVRLLEQFGNTRVLSSPKLMALNNQTALLKVVDNIVYFSIESQQGVVTGGGVITAPTFTTTAHTVPVGVIMSLTPQINEDGRVTLTVRPTVSRILGFKNDPNPSLGTGANRIVNQVPEIQVREMESVLQVGSGQTVILGGLMQDDTSRSRDAVPGIGSVPGIGEAFGYRDDNLVRTELVIFLRPIVVSNPSLDSDELRYFRRFLPDTSPAAAGAPAAAR